MSYTPLNQEEDEDNVDLVPPTQSQKTRVAGAMVLLVAVAALSAGALPRRNQQHLSAESDVFMVSNEYERARGFPLNDGLIQHMVQVHKTTRLELASKVPSTFHVEDSPGSGNFIAVNEEAAPFVEHIFQDHGVFRVKVVPSTGDDLVTHEFAVNAKIIRYEIRDLSESDRQLYFDTLQKYYFTGQEEGEAAFGADFKSLSYLLREHLYGAADKECDHWHDDAGILTHHVGVTWEFEASLRKISPGTASHYWDYTREEALGIDWYDSPIFGDDWFGCNSPNNPDHIVDKGRFAYTPVPSAVGFSETMNPYGLLRSPWNTNPTPYLLRSNETFFSLADSNTVFPSCAAFAAYVDSSLAEVLNALNGELHGPVHIMIGGHWHSQSEWKTVASNYRFDDAFLLLSKWLWRQGFVRTPESCSSDVPGADCMPTCPEGITGTLDSKQAYELLEKTGVTEMLYKSKVFDTYMKASGLDWLDLWNELCHVGWPGEMFTSAAPQDPTFWPLHGNAERYVMYLRVLKKWGIVSFDETWGYFHDQYTASNTGVVCDWSGVTTDTGMPTCTKGTCTGHREDDLLPFTNLYTGQGDSFLTNAQMLARIDPFHDDMPYAYDSLSFWEGCTDSNLLSEYNALYDADLDVHQGVPYWKSFASNGASKDSAPEARSEEAVLSGDKGPGSVEAARWWGVF